MNTHANKTPENKSQSASSVVSLKTRNGGSSCQFVDNRPEAMAQRKLREMENYSPQANRVIQWQAIMDIHSAQQKRSILTRESTAQLKGEVIQMNPKQVAGWVATNDFFTPEFGGGRVISGNDIFVPTAHIYPHIHIGKDFVVLSKSSSNHIELMRGDQIFKGRIQNNLNGHMGDIDQVLRYMDSQF